MKTLVLINNQEFQIQDRDLVALEKNHCRVRIINAGVCSSDVQRSYEYGAYFYPLVMGHELAGEIVEVGEGSERFKTGDRVTIFPLLPCFKCDACKKEIFARCCNYSYYGSRKDGGFAEYLNVNDWNILPLPDNVAMEDAAAIEPLSVVVHALRKMELLDSKKKKSPKNIAIIGAGFLGLLMARILCQSLPGTRIVVIDRNKFKLDVASKYGSDVILLKNSDEWKSFINSNVFENVIEATGNPQAFDNSIQMTAHGGKVLWMGNITDDLALPKTHVSSMLRKEISILGIWNSIYKPDKPDDWKKAITLIQQGIRPSELVTHWVTLEEVPAVLKKLYLHKTGEKPFESIKVMVRN